MATIDVKDAAGLTVAVEKPLVPGAAAAASSRPVTLSTEDVARVGIITETAPATDTASSGMNGRLQRIAQRLSSLIALHPTALGSAAAASSLAVTASTEDVARAGIVTETAPATDTASSGINGRLQRIAQRVTSLIALVPASLGSKADAASLAVTQSTEDKAVLAAMSAKLPATLGSKADAASLAVTKSTEDKALTGALTETAPATDTASSGLNGRLQRIAQRITSLIALVPASLGAKTSAASFSVVLASDQAAIAVTGAAAGTEYTEDAAAAANPVGGVVMGVRRDTLTVAEVSADGDNVVIKATSKGQLHVAAEIMNTGTAIDNSNPLVTSSATTDPLVLTVGAKTDAKSAATDATSISAMQVWKQISASVQLFLFGAGTAAAALRATLASDDPLVTVTGAKTDAKSTATDATSVSGMSVWKQISASVQLFVFGAGTAAAAQRTTLASDDPTVTVLGATSGAAVITDVNGTIQQYLRGLVKQWIAGTLVLGTGANAIGKLAANSGVDIGDVDVVALTGSTIAHDSVDSGNPHKIGAKAKATLSGEALVAADDRVNVNAALDGSLYVRNVPLGDIVSGNASNTDGTSTSCIATAGAGIKQYLSRVVLTNMHASTVAYVELKSGTTVMATIPCPPGGATVGFDPPLPPNAANEAWNFDPSAAVTTIYCSMVGFKSKI